MNDNKLVCSAKAEILFVHPLLLALIVALMAGSLAACKSSSKDKAASKSGLPSKETPGGMHTPRSIYLYGEEHGEAKIINKEFELWSDYYHNKGMRHLFVELSYFTAEYLNVWMRSDNDEILEEIYTDWEGSAGHNPYSKAFYKKIKSECPETIFHGTDVGHQYNKTGSRFLAYLEANDRKGSEEYVLTIEAIEQGRFYHSQNDDVYRENKMAENFIREFEKLGSENVMGIYGSAHTGLHAMDYQTQSIPCMANQLKEHYGDSLYSEDLSWMAKATEPSRVDSIPLQGKKYAASYFGKQDLKGFKDYAYREFWRLEDAYDAAKDLPLADNSLPYNNYPMRIEAGQVFVIRYTRTDGSVEREYYLSNGPLWQGLLSTQQFLPD